MTEDTIPIESIEARQWHNSLRLICTVVEPEHEAAGRTATEWVDEIIANEWDTVAEGVSIYLQGYDPVAHDVQYELIALFMEFEAIGFDGDIAVETTGGHVPSSLFDHYVDAYHLCPQSPTNDISRYVERAEEGTNLTVKFVIKSEADIEQVEKIQASTDIPAKYCSYALKTDEVSHEAFNRLHRNS